MVAPVHAAGGVLYRPGADGTPEVCLVHRPRYDDWSLPKGTVKRGEPALAAAVREVAEETGAQGIPEFGLPEVSYVLPGGRPKTVRFWLMRAAGDDGPVQDTDEVDKLTWLPIPEAVDRLTYPDERPLLDLVAGLPPVTSVVALVRHAHAGERKHWSGPDSLRPISPKGQRQAGRVAERLATFRPRRLVAATPLRCSQTLHPLAAATGLPLVVDPAFAEPDDPSGLPARLRAARARLAELRAAGRVVVCSQGKVMPPLLAELTGAGDAEPYRTRKGDGWLLTWSGATLLGVSHW
ncbi:8-oxo-dGTP diphosphatase [Actinoplanes ianthinogenes]|uniref:8-oxo-dGTP diphosphatase n=1 Tax=Actinoplanes ianthinogenes TaxID=122358 RepID=A0ABN6CAM4_9ACTN|nr:NUDIX hydrolase [Actinoplanes ianthinogenes]BCJ42524.1 8-oxo-dGTP diphosphatase [Actinoplanes ianthinogenes]GGQ94016.1 8-oxo-dGTP diphosphatase [Actinoplanes ianthinogenes]